MRSRELPVVGIGAAVHYTISVLDPDGREVERRARKRNLVLDQGLNLVATTAWCNLFSVAAVGTGTTPVKRDSGAILFTRAANVVTADAGFFEAGDVGRLLKFDSGEEMYITAFTDAQNVSVSVSGALPGGTPGTVWYVNQTALTTEVKRASTYGGDSGDNGMTFSLGSMVNKRTFIFSAEAGSVTYNEVGWSNTGAAGANLFGRDVISGGVTLSAGQQLKVIVELTLTATPQALTAYASVISGWTQPGAFNVESISKTGSLAICYVDDFGGTAVPTGFGLSVLEPSHNKYLALATDATPIVAQTSTDLAYSGEIAKITLVGDAYVSGTFTRTYRGTFAVGQGNSTGIRSLCVTGSNGGSNRIFRVLLDAAETKDSAHTLEIVFRLTWGRVLVN